MVPRTQHPGPHLLTFASGCPFYLNYRPSYSCLLSSLSWASSCPGALPQLSLSTWQARSAVSPAHVFPHPPNSHHTCGRVFSLVSLNQNSVHSSKQGTRPYAPCHLSFVSINVHWFINQRKAGSAQKISLKYVEVHLRTRILVLALHAVSAVNSGLECVWGQEPLPNLRGSTQACPLVKRCSGCPASPVCHNS